MATLSRARVATTSVKLESTYGSDATVAGGTDDLQTYDSDVAASVKMNFLALRPHGNTFTRPKQIPTKRSYEFTYTWLMQTSGALGTVAVNGYASIDALIRSAGCTSTVSAGTSITYSPATIATLDGNANVSSTQVVTHHGILFKGTGCHNNLIFRGRSDDAMRVETRAMGLYNAVAFGTTSSWGGATQRAGAFLSAACSIIPSGGGTYTPILSAVEFDMGVEVQEVLDANSSTGLSRFLITDRNPRLNVTIALDTDNSAALTSPNIWAHALAGTTHNVTFKAIGLNSSGTATFNVPTAQVAGDPTMQVQNGYRTITIPYLCQHTTAETEFTITLT